MYIIIIINGQDFLKQGWEVVVKGMGQVSLEG